MSRAINSQNYINELCVAVKDSLSVAPVNPVPDSFSVDYVPTHESVNRDYAVVLNVADVTHQKGTKGAGAYWYLDVAIRVVVRRNLAVTSQSSGVGDMLGVVAGLVDHLKTDLNSTKVYNAPFALQEISQEPVYDYTSVLEDNLFISVFTATYRGIV